MWIMHGPYHPCDTSHFIWPEICLLASSRRDDLCDVKAAHPIRACPDNWFHRTGKAPWSRSISGISRNKHGPSRLGPRPRTLAKDSIGAGMPTPFAGTGGSCLRSPSSVSVQVGC